jgi:hypothetical protein
MEGLNRIERGRRNGVLQENQCLKTRCIEEQLTSKKVSCVGNITKREKVTSISVTQLSFPLPTIKSKRGGKLTIVIFSKEKNGESIERAIECEIALPSVKLRACSLNLTTMSPPQVGAPSRTVRSTQSSTQGPQGEASEMPIVVDVDKIHTPEYEKTTLHVEEGKEPA